MGKVTTTFDLYGTSILRSGVGRLLIERAICIVLRLHESDYRGAATIDRNPADLRGSSFNATSTRTSKNGWRTTKPDRVTPDTKRFATAEPRRIRRPTLVVMRGGRFV